ncbi:MAG TPA: paraquat-inducible protein A [Deltaproteobacteria bacterium]|nr:paraquat-inducible protein A [Deltaproteobacteria bacterium]HQB39486.1 paraquat-inducible protein A [Deltaproteobacteria bacterium]
MSIPHRHLIICHECDQVLKEIPLPNGGVACCSCCGATLYRHTQDSINRTLAFAVAAAVMYVIANCFPIIGIDFQGNYNEVTLPGAISSVWNQGRPVISTLVLFCIIVAPAVEIMLMICLLLPVRMGQKALGVYPIMRTLQVIKTWGMVEVFMLGILVALVKLTTDFIVIYEVAIWAFAALTLLLASMTASFNPREVWQQLDQIAEDGEAP